MTNRHTNRYVYSVIVPVAVAHAFIDRMGAEGMAQIEVRYMGHSVELVSPNPIHMAASDFAADQA